MPSAPPESAPLNAWLSATRSDPFAWLGPHQEGNALIVRSFQPGARKVEILNSRHEYLASLPSSHDCSGLFAGKVSGLGTDQSYLLRIFWSDAEAGDSVQITEDPYAFGLLLSDDDLHLLSQGLHLELARCLGAQLMSVAGIAGTRFAVWAPNANSVSVVGDFNRWDGRRHPMRLRHGGGIWELFVPRLATGNRYKYALTAANGRLLPLKADPLASATEVPPASASVVASATPFPWSDSPWMSTRARRQSAEAPLAIYEVHLASWMRVHDEQARNLNWPELSERLIPYALGLGFTHIELLPIMEHPFGGSWGYQPLSQFAPSARFGTPREFAGFVDACHDAGLGVILDWVPGHFPSDAHGLAQFDGSALYEHADPQEGFHPDWNTLIFNLGRNEVCGFLIASALEWLEHFHVDGLRVDAVASMLYRDYSRKPGEWIANCYGGRENLEAVAFLRKLNQTVAERCPGALMIAEESTAWPGVSAALASGGLGFSFKWNMGWMHDTLRYMQLDPLFRRDHHNDLSFGLLYAFSERFILPISHDEVTHGKGSLLAKMPGDSWRQLANLRAYLAFMWTHPGKKLLFMGCEFAQPGEWDHDQSLPWALLDDPAHRGVQQMVRDLNRLYVAHPALHQLDCQPDGFSWVIGDDNQQSVLAFLRHADPACAAPPLLVICNMTPVPRHGYRVGVPTAAPAWQELFNSDAAVYGGGNLGNGGHSTVESISSHGFPASLVLTLPPLSTLILHPGVSP
jgi:1,4-alpha-glucan branching enzyme